MSNVCDITAECLAMPRNEVLPSSRLIEDLNCDSLELVELLISLEDAFSVAIPADPPNLAYKSVFVRQPFRLSDLAEIIYLQQGSKSPERSQSRREAAVPCVAPKVPFTQLNGRWNGSPTEAARLFEPLASEGSVRQFRRRTDGMRCILVPQARVELGSNAPESLIDEKPVHTAQLEAFLIDAEPVSSTAYCRFLNSIAADQQQLQDWLLLAPQDDRREHMPIQQIGIEWQPIASVEHLPMVLVSWYGANAYSLWANGHSWTDYRTHEGFLPTEAQWEYAARGSASQSFPWGNAPDETLMRCAQHECGDKYTSESLPMAAVNEELGMSPFGLHHMAGNVWQWCRDWYDDGFYHRVEASHQNPVNRIETGVRSERGGSWVGPASLCRSSYRRGRVPHARGRCLGFRCISHPS